MTLRYRDLPATAFAPHPERLPDRPADGRWSGLSISPKGEVYLILYRKGFGSTVHSHDGQQMPLKPPHREAFWSPSVQRFADGRWLIVEPRTEELDPNAYIFEPDGSFSHSFYAGDGIEAVLIDKLDRIWIGYFDEGVFGAVNTPPEHRMRKFGPNGLVRLDDRGELEFGFNENARDRDISDIYALTIDDANRIWLCPYHEFYLASVDDDTIGFVLDEAPVAGSQAMCVGPDHFVFFGGYYRDCMITVVERKTQRLRLIQLRNQDGSPFSPRLLATRGERAFAMVNDRLYRLDLDVLLDALGPWLDDNSSSVASAVRYMEEESSYADGSVLIVATGEVRELPGKPRPPENQPRDDECGEP